MIDHSDSPDPICQSLIDATVALIDERGPRAFTPADVARRAQVAEDELALRFASADELKAAVAIEGYRRLAFFVQAAMASAATPLERLLSAGEGYVSFALRYPNHLTVMFDVPPQCLLDMAATKRKNSKTGFHRMLEAVVACQEAGDLPPGDPMQIFMAIWGIAHGISRLSLGKTLPLGPRQAQTLTRSTCEAFFEGLRRRAVAHPRA